VRPGLRLDSPQAIPTEVDMRLIGLAVVLTLNLLAASIVSDAQQPGTPARIGALTARSREATTASWEAFRLGLRDLWLRGGEPRRPGSVRQRQVRSASRLSPKMRT
jgi:hypothetical protein